MYFPPPQLSKAQAGISLGCTPSQLPTLLGLLAALVVVNRHPVRGLPGVPPAGSALCCSLLACEGQACFFPAGPFRCHLTSPPAIVLG